jgi:predicted hydrocarbon binding protein
MVTGLPPISRKNARVFWVNVALGTISLIAYLALTSETDKKAILGVGLWAQIGLLILSTLLGMLLTAIDDLKDASSQQLDRLQQKTLSAIHDIEAESQRFREDLSKGIVEYQGMSYRSLRYEKNRGAIYYGAAVSENRNILFNNETLKTMFQVIKAARCGSDAVLYDGRPLLYAIGYAASQRFALHFQQYVEQKGGRSFELEPWLNYWTEYDSDAGFGNLEARRVSEGEADIIIKNSFLTHGIDHGGRESLCDFMQGYIEGLLKNFAPQMYEKHNLDRENIRVEHGEADCYRRHRDHDTGCIFRVHVPVKKPKP